LQTGDSRCQAPAFVRPERSRRALAQHRCNSGSTCCAARTVPITQDIPTISRVVCGSTGRAFAATGQGVGDRSSWYGV